MFKLDNDTGSENAGKLIVLLAPTCKLNSFLTNEGMVAQSLMHRP